MAKKNVSATVSGAGMLTSIFAGIDKALKDNGGTGEEVHILSTPEGEPFLDQLAKGILGKKAQVGPEPELSKYIIDCDAEPFCPQGWEVVEHRKGGQLEWDPSKVGLFLAEEQKTRSIQGHELRKLLADQPVFNANVLDYLWANQHLIPEEWKAQFVFFWGTIYRDPDGSLCVRCLDWLGFEWSRNYHRLDNYWLHFYPAAVSLPAS